MASSIIQIIIKTVYNPDKLKKMRRDLRSATTAAQRNTKKLQALSTITRKLQRGMLSLGLAFLFFGMAVNKAAMKGLRAVINVWAEAMEGTAMYNQTLGRLNAAFTFLKFSIMDAFVTSALGQMLLEMLFSLIDAVNAFIDRHPGLAALVVPFLAIAAAVGLLMFIFGQIMLFLLPFATAIGALALGKFPLFNKVVFAMRLGLKILLRIVAKLAFWIVVIIAFMTGFVEGFVDGLKATGQFETGMKVLTGVLKGVWAVLKFLLITSFKILFWVVKQVGIAVGFVIGLLFGFIIIVVKNIAAIAKWVLALNPVVAVFNKIKKAIQAVIDVKKKLANFAGGVVSKAKSMVGLAHGGIVTSPTRALIGEAGPEAVIPLDQMGSMGGTNNINVEVNVGGSQASPEDIADSVIEAIQRELSRRGLSSGV